MSNFRARGGRLGRTIELTLPVAAVLTGCGTQTIVKTVTTSGTSTTCTQASAARRQQAKVGDTLTLKGSDGESMAVTVNQVMDPLQAGSYDQPESGQRLVGIQITLKNVGSVAYSDSPSNGSTLISNTNEQARVRSSVAGLAVTILRLPQTSLRATPSKAASRLKCLLGKRLRPSSSRSTQDSRIRQASGHWRAGLRVVLRPPVPAATEAPPTARRA